MKKLAQSLLNLIVAHPGKVKVKQKEEDGLLTLIVRVSPEDIGKVIGKKGRTIKALTALVRVKAIKEGKRVNVELQEYNPVTQ